MKLVVYINNGIMYIVLIHDNFALDFSIRLRVLLLHPVLLNSIVLRGV